MQFTLKCSTTWDFAITEYNRTILMRQTEHLLREKIQKIPRIYLKQMCQAKQDFSIIKFLFKKNERIKLVVTLQSHFNFQTSDVSHNQLTLLTSEPRSRNHHKECLLPEGWSSQHFRVNCNLNPFLKTLVYEYSTRCLHPAQKKLALAITKQEQRYNLNPKL